MPKEDKYPIRCSKCNTVYGALAHLELYNKRICNKCCPTSKYDKNGLFMGCDCKNKKEVQNEPRKN